MDQNSQLKDTEGLFEFKGKKKKTYLHAVYTRLTSGERIHSLKGKKLKNISMQI